MAFRKRNLIYGIIAAVLHSTLLGNAQSQTEDAETISVIFSTLKVGSGSFEGIRYFESQDKVSSPLDFRLVQRSGPYEYRGPREITFFETIPAPSAADPEAVVNKPLARTSIPRGLTNVLLFFEKLSRKDQNDGESLPYRIHIMDDSMAGFPENSVVVFNACGPKLVGSVGKERRRFEYGPANPIDYGRVKTGSFSTAFAVETSDGPKLVFENRLELSKGYRVILMLAPPRRQGSIRIEVYSIPQPVDSQPPITAN
ncbi:MAG: hypothetical protein GVY36_00550 [Verrucomicrobia bacterium]|jgi:hypothetical protein|nr:hypothetical protein [Verrucomicrobiota bacterium]